MAISNAVKVGQIDLVQVNGPAHNSAMQVGISMGYIEDKNAYIQQIARIAVGDLDPQVELSEGEA